MSCKFRTIDQSGLLRLENLFQSKSIKNQKQARDKIIVLILWLPFGETLAGLLKTVSNIFTGSLKQKIQ
jgi:hypothetical protein